MPDKIRAWLSGLFTGVAVAHLLPLIIRHNLEIAGKFLTTRAALITTIISGVLAAFFYFWRPKKDEQNKVE